MWAFLPAILSARQIEQHYKIYDTRQQKIITLDDIVKSLENTQVLFFGEEHNDSIGHYLEAELLKKIHIAYPPTVLTLEMFHTDTQPILNEYLNGLISEKNFIKEARAWNNYKDYRPMVEYAKENKLQVLGANAATRYSNAVTKGGLAVLNGFPKTSKSLLAPLPIDTATGRYYDKFIETLGGHNMGSMKIYQTQNLWDATMAWSIFQHLKKNRRAKVFQVNGRFHSDEKLGTAAQLMSYMPKAKIANISCFSADDFDRPNWENYKQLGDFIILTDPKISKTF